MLEKKLIRLWDSVGLGLIIQAPSGVMYSNQAGGTCCLQPSEEGFFVPLHDEVRGQEQMLLDYFREPGAPSASPSGFHSKTADFIDEVLAVSVATRFLKVDRMRLEDSVEAWVYVEVSDQPDDPLPRSMEPSAQQPPARFGGPRITARYQFRRRAFQSMGSVLVRECLPGAIAIELRTATDKDMQQTRSSLSVLQGLLFGISFPPLIPNLMRSL